MARSVFSIVQWEDSGTLSAGTHLGPGPPTGFVWVVRDIVAFSPIEPSIAVGGFFISHTGGAPILFVNTEEAWGGHQYSWQGRQVIEEGNTLSLTQVTANWEFRVCGYELALP